MSLMTTADHNSIMTASLLTPPGFGGIAVIGIVGGGINMLIAGIFTSSSKVDVANMVPGRFYLGQVRDREEVIDQVMLLVESGGNSAEIHCHGGPRIIQRVMLLLKSLGVSIVDWHMQASLDSIEAEQDYYLARARTPLAISLLACQCPGGLFQWCRQWFHNAGLPGFSLSDYHREAGNLLKTAEISRNLLEPARVAFVGSPNAGKSSLANKLTGRVQSLVSDLPGTTRDWTAQLTDLAGVPVELIDTAGLRDSDDELEIMSIQKAKELLAEVDLAVILVPAMQIHEFATVLARHKASLPPSLNILPIISRADELSPSDNVGALPAMLVSSVTEQGFEQLKNAIREKLGVPLDFDFRHPAIFTPRQRDIIASTMMQTEPKIIADILLNCLGGIS